MLTLSPLVHVKAAHRGKIEYWEVTTVLDLCFTTKLCLRLIFTGDAQTLYHQQPEKIHINIFKIKKIYSVLHITVVFIIIFHPSLSDSVIDSEF